MNAEVELEKAYAACEARLEQERAPLLVAARELEDPLRRRAFHAVYLSLRLTGPACLPRPVGRSRTPEQALRAVRAWRDTARLCHQGQPDPAEPTEVALADAMSRFSLPMTPWLTLEEGLLSSIRNEPVADMAVFITRARRLAQAPSSAFFRIICSKLGWRRYHVDRDIDVDELAHDPAVFAFVVGVMCDVFSEAHHTRPAVTSIPADLMRRHGMTVERLLEIRSFVHAPRDFEDLMQDMAGLARKFYDSGVAKLTQAAARLPGEAVEMLDGFLTHYRRTLAELYHVRFAPSEFERLAAALEPRASHVRLFRAGPADGQAFPAP